MNLSPTTLAVFGGALLLGAAWICGLHRRGRKTLLRGLAALDEARREQLLAELTPKVQAELRQKLAEPKMT